MLNKRHTIETSSLYWSLNLLFSRIKGCKTKGTKDKDFILSYPQKQRFDNFSSRALEHYEFFCLNYWYTCVFISTQLVKYFAHCNQAFVKFVVISSWLDPHNKKKLIQTRRLCSALSVLYKQSFCPWRCQNAILSIVLKLTEVIFQSQ